MFATTIVSSRCLAYLQSRSTYLVKCFLVKQSALLRVSIFAAVGMLLTAPLHGVAYLRTLDGEPGAVDWGPGAYRLAPSLWDWGERQSVYLTYGKVTSVLLVVSLLGLVALHRRQSHPQARFERWAFRVFGVGYTFMAIGAIAEYYTPFLEEAFLFIAIPGLLLTLLGGLAFGIASSRVNVLSQPLSWYLAFSFLPGVPLLVAVLGHIPVGFSLVMVALIIIGLKLSGETPESGGTPAAQ